MPKIERHNPGAFCWFELGTTDQNAAKSFYTTLFGWSFNEFPMGPTEVYTTYQLEGHASAAAYTLRSDQRAQGVPPHWLLYIATNNADETARRAEELGGKVYAPPFDVMELGRMAVLADPTGATFAVWQAKQHPGVGSTGVPGTVCWADLSTPDVDTAKKFYTGLFGWEIATGEGDPSGYQHIKNGSEFIGGVPPAAHRSPQTPPHWLIYFLVAECDASAAKAKQLGAEFLLPPQTVPHVGRMAITKDPQGAIFALFEPERK